jgi:hypothetical protein
MSNKLTMKMKTSRKLTMKMKMRKKMKMKEKMKMRKKNENEKKDQDEKTTHTSSTKCNILNAFTLHKQDTLFAFHTRFLHFTHALHFTWSCERTRSLIWFSLRLWWIWNINDWEHVSCVELIVFELRCWDYHFNVHWLTYLCITRSSFVFRFSVVKERTKTKHHNNTRDRITEENRAR